jgi:hypothetical protein
MQEPKNIVELNNDLLRIYDNIENKKIGLNVAKEKANIAGKVVKGYCGLQEYNNKMGYKKKIAFWEVPDAK